MLRTCGLFHIQYMSFIMRRDLRQYHAKTKERHKIKSLDINLIHPDAGVDSSHKFVPHLCSEWLGDESCGSLSTGEVIGETWIRVLI